MYDVTCIGASFVDHFFLSFVVRVSLCYTILSVHCSCVTTFMERADLCALFCVVFYCVWYLIAPIPDVHILSYVKKIK